MPIVTFTSEVQLTLELAFAIEDPAGIEAIELANTILRIFRGREGEQLKNMHQSLLQWSLQYPRVEKSPDTERCQKGNKVIGLYGTNDTLPPNTLTKPCPFKDELCPECKGKLKQSPNGWSCPNGHGF